jgi:hypothetical protein
LHLQNGVKMESIFKMAILRLSLRPSEPLVFLPKRAANNWSIIGSHKKMSAIFTGLIAGADDDEESAEDDDDDLFGFADDDESETVTKKAEKDKKPPKKVSDDDDDSDDDDFFGLGGLFDGFFEDEQKKPKTKTKPVVAEVVDAAAAIPEAVANTADTIVGLADPVSDEEAPVESADAAEESADAAEESVDAAVESAADAALTFSDNVANTIATTSPSLLTKIVSNKIPIQVVSLNELLQATNGLNVINEPDLMTKLVQLKS